MRPCGCDWDVRVFGHAYCWTPRIGVYITKHVICQCRMCPCTVCHKDR